MTQRVISGSTYNLTYDAENRLTGVSGFALTPPRPLLSHQWARGGCRASHLQVK
jgi:hypothetical protein